MRNNSKTIITLILLLFAQMNFAQESTSEKTDTSKIIIEKMPQYPGGEKAMFQFLMNSITYPEDAARNSIRGRVMVRFLVTENGDIENIEVMKSVYPSLDAEAVRVIRSMPKWVPGMMKGEPVAVYFSLPITFSLQGCDDVATNEKGMELTPKELEAIDDSNHPDKSKLLGLWEYEPEALKYTYTFKDKEKEKIHGKEVRESLKKGRVLLVEAARGSTIDFKADNTLVTTNIKDGKTSSSPGFYKLQGDTLFMHSIILRGTKILTYKIDNSRLITKSVVSSELMDVTFIMRLKKIK